MAFIRTLSTCDNDNGTLHEASDITKGSIIKWECFSSCWTFPRTRVVYIIYRGPHWVKGGFHPVVHQGRQTTILNIIFRKGKAVNDVSKMKTWLD